MLQEALCNIMGFPAVNISGRLVTGQDTILLPQENYPALYPEQTDASQAVASPLVSLHPTASTSQPDSKLYS